jgi:hypothetical protein
MGSKFERGEDCFESVLNIHTPLSSSLTPVLLFVCLQLSSQKLLLGGINIGGEGGICPSTQVMAMFSPDDRQSVHKSPDFVTKMRKWRISYVG